MPAVNLSDNSDFAPVWNVVVEHAATTQRPQPRSVLVVYADGSLAEVKRDGRAKEAWGDSPGDFPAAVGWSFRGAMVAFNGHAFPLGGLRYRLLRALVDGGGKPVRDEVLKTRVWSDDETNIGRLKDLAFGLRAFLRAELRLTGDNDPVERVEGGYRLAVK